MANINIQSNLGLPPKVVEKLLAGEARKIPHLIVFDIEVDSGSTFQTDTRTPASGCFQIEFVNVGGSDIFKFNIKDTYFNQNWFDAPVYSYLFGGDGKSMGLLPCPVVLPPSTSLIISARYDSTDPNSGGSDKVVGQIILGGYILEGITAEDLMLRR